MKWQDITISNVITETSIGRYVGSYSDFLKLNCELMVKKMINEISDRDVPDKLYMMIKFSDKPIHDMGE